MNDVFIILKCSRVKNVSTLQVDCYDDCHLNFYYRYIFYPSIKTSYTNVINRCDINYVHLHFV